MKTKQKKIKLPKKVTVTWLLNRGACSGQVNMFDEVFPKGMEVTVANLRKADKAGLNWFWFFNTVGISVTGPNTFQGALRKGLRAVAKALEEG